MGKLINRIPGSLHLISRLPGSALRTLVDILRLALMNSSLWFNKIHLGLSIVYIEGSPLLTDYNFQIRR